jgi:hypothetical protein
MARQVISEDDRHRIDGEIVGDQLQVRFTGRLDEYFDFTRLQAFVDSKRSSFKRSSFDMAGVTDLNSIGIRGWLALLKSLLLHGPVEFSQISATFLEQANIMPMMLGEIDVPVHAVEVNYFCDRDRKGFTKMVKVADLKRGAGGDVEAPEVKCPKCLKPAELDAHPKEYFAALKGRPV